MTSPPAEFKPERFGTLIGVAPGNVPVYSSDYDTADDAELPTRQSYRSYVDGIYMGYKWQCVEFARRWLYLNRGYIFDDVAMAYEIFRLTSVRLLDENKLLPLHSFRNGCARRPEPGCLLIWQEGGEFEHTGHVAIVTEVFPDRLRIAEQNVGDRRWPDGVNYAREIKAKTTASGEYWLECSFGDATILGWVMQTDDDYLAEVMEPAHPELFAPYGCRLPEITQQTSGWLNEANADEGAYVDMMHGHLLSSRPDDLNRYVCLSETAAAELRRATNELHNMFMQATNHVLANDELLAQFNLPAVLWPRIRQSWSNRRNQLITARFDFSVSASGLKVYEYNCDSASCHMETGVVQGKWARHFGCDVGEDPGAQLRERLRDAWSHSDVDGVLHILQDDDPEETYHALFMRKAMEQAGIECKIIKGLDGLHWSDEGKVVDADGAPISWVWKTWAWETVLDQLRAECEQDDFTLRASRERACRRGQPRLADVLLLREVMVYEPLWTLIPSNKAILPVLWELFEGYPYLLEASFDLTDSLENNGYVTKPIVGRGGANIAIFDGSAQPSIATGGHFEDRDQIYQAFWPLPQLENYFVQISTFTAAGRYAGTCVRADESPVISMLSENLALRIVPDREALSLAKRGVDR